ncbi:MAG: diaminopimelate decarboxylase, partial [Frankiaceae bacterium]|nr:diaminopimelate decarboxylase [Frankiaceae bacterium]
MTTHTDPGLDPVLWPRHADVAEDGMLVIAGRRVDDLVAEFGSPLFELDEDDFRARAREYRDAFGGAASVYYAGMAFLWTAVARWVAEEGLSLDVCTGGELAVARAAGFPPERLLFHGNNKSVDELRRAVE